MTNEQFVADLRKVADFFEAHPDFPLPSGLRVDVWTNDKRAFAEAVRTIGGGEKKYFDSVFSVRRLFGEVQLDVNIARKAVCELVVVGKRTIPAQPEREEEITEWRCSEPILEGE